MDFRSKLILLLVLFPFLGFGQEIQYLPTSSSVDSSTYFVTQERNISGSFGLGKKTPAYQIKSFTGSGGGGDSSNVTGTKYRIPKFNSTHSITNSNWIDSSDVNRGYLMDTVHFTVVPMATLADSPLVIGNNKGTLRKINPPTGTKGVSVLFPSNVYFVDSSVIPKWDDTLAGNLKLITLTKLNSYGFGTGTVTSISSGYGITETPSPITTTGTIKVDTTTIIPWTDTLVGNLKVITPYRLSLFGYGTHTLNQTLIDGNTTNYLNGIKGGEVGLYNSFILKLQSDSSGQFILSDPLGNTTISGLTNIGTSKWNMQDIHGNSLQRSYSIDITNFGLTRESALDTTGLFLSDGLNMRFGTSTGTKIGTSSSQKIGFFNATPIIQPSGSVISGLNALGLFSSSSINISEISGLGSGIATFLATPSSANFFLAITDETGSGLAVGNNSPRLISPNSDVYQLTGVTSGTVTCSAPSTITSYTWSPPSAISTSTGYAMVVSGISGSSVTTTWSPASGASSGISNLVLPTNFSQSGTTTVTISYTTLNTITDAANFVYNGNNGSIQKITLGASRTFTITNLVQGVRYVFEAIQDGTGSRVLTWGTTVKVAYAGAGSPPQTSTASATDIYYFTYDGTNIFVDYALNFN